MGCSEAEAAKSCNYLTAGQESTVMRAGLWTVFCMWSQTKVLNKVKFKKSGDLQSY